MIHNSTNDILVRNVVKLFFLSQENQKKYSIQFQIIYKTGAIECIWLKLIPFGGLHSKSGIFYVKESTCIENRSAHANFEGNVNKTLTPNVNN